MTAENQAIVIDLNADIGEGAAYDADLVPLVSSVNISCGAHAGSEHDIMQALEQAAHWDVATGAHPSYPDRAHQGRRSMSLSPTALRESIVGQLHWLAERAERAGAVLQHVKPHGALYNDVAINEALALQLCASVAEFDRTLTIVGLAGGRLQDAARQTGMTWRAEAFVDRRYQANGTLVSRLHPRALVVDHDEAVAQAMSIIRQRQVNNIDGGYTSVAAQTLCIHGDTPGAVQFAQALRAALDIAAIRVTRPHPTPLNRSHPDRLKATTSGRAS